MNRRQTPYRLCCFLVVLFAMASLPEAAPAAEPSTTFEKQAPEVPGGRPRLSPLELEELLQMEVTTVTRTASTVGESAAAVTVITQEDIRRSGATTIAELFRRVPGMNVARIDNNKWAISARGFNDRFANKLLVQIDGRTLYNALFSGVYWDTVDYPLEDIERIEVIRGPGASVWGANAVNGVINIITKSSVDTQGGFITAGGGNEEQGLGTFRYGGKIDGNTTYRVYGKGFTRDEQFSREGDPNDRWRGASAGMRVDWQATDNDAVTLQGDYVHSVAGRRDLRPMVTPPFQFTNIEDEVTDEGNILGRWNRRLSDDSNWALQAYWDRFERNSDNDILISKYDLFDLDFQHQFALGDAQTIVYGVGYRLLYSRRRESFDNGFIFGFNDLTRHTQLFSSFVQDEITVVPERLKLLLGSKFEHNDFTGFEVQPTVRLTWTPTKRQTVWGAASRAVRTPSINEDNSRLTFLPFAGTSTFLQGQPSPDMEAEELLAYELGYRAQATEKMSVDLAFFYNDYENLRSNLIGRPFAGPAGTTLIPVFFANELDGETYGVETAVTWQATEWWRLYGAYTFVEIQLHRPASLPASAEAAEGQTPQQQVYVQSSWNFPADIEFDLIGRYVDGLSGFNPTGGPAAADTIDSYFALDARLGWQPRKDLMLEIVGQNLLDDQHPEFGTNPFIRNPLVEIERSVYGKVTWRF